MTVKVPIIPKEDLSENGGDADPLAADHAEIHSDSTQAEVDEAVAAAKRESLNRTTGKGSRANG